MEILPFPVHGPALFGVYFICLGSAWQRMRHPAGLDFLAVAVLIAVPALALRLSRNASDAAFIACGIVPFHLVLGGALEWVLLFGIGGSAWFAMGFWSHVRYRRLERRLAALRAPA
jgi:hypothetical protein